MPTEIVGLDELVPDDIEFRYKGHKYVLPGDISVSTTYKLQKLLLALGKAELDVAASKPGPAQMKALAEQQRQTLEVEALLLALFRERDTKLESLPFGVVGFQVVLARVLQQLGFGEDTPPDPPKPRTATKSSKSRRSSTPRSS